ncbi:MAG: PaaI family thioesterase [Chloroflexales bacterium]|nr:PaaI family thioesterase [Chloroflexales bacterium]
MTEQQRLVTWQSPSLYIDQMRQMSGTEYINAVRAGDMPVSPMLKLLDIHGREWHEGYALFTVVPQEFHYNPMGIAHGGLACALLDTAMAVSVMTMLPQASKSKSTSPNRWRATVAKCAPKGEPSMWAAKPPLPMGVSWTPTASSTPMAPPRCC